MVDGESIEKREMFNGNQKTNYYEISDPMIRFYYSLIYPNLEDIQRRFGKEVYELNKNIENTLNLLRLNSIIFILILLMNGKLLMIF